MDRISISEVLDSGSIPDGGTSLVRQLRYTFNIEPLSAEINELLQRYNNPQQIGLMHSALAKNDEDRIFESTGASNTGPDRKQLRQDTDFSIFNENLYGTELHKMYLRLSEDMIIHRMRIMVMNPSVCYLAHVDTYERYHLAIETNPNCYFVFTEKGIISHIPADGHLYFSDTKHRHTFINAGRTRRIHIIFSGIKESDVSKMPAV